MLCYLYALKLFLFVVALFLFVFLGGVVLLFSRRFVVLGCVNVCARVVA